MSVRQVRRVSCMVRLPPLIAAWQNVAPKKLVKEWEDKL